MISELIQRIQRFQRTPYTFTLDNDLKKYLLQSYVCPHTKLQKKIIMFAYVIWQVTMDDNTAYKLSLKIDPKVLWGSYSYK